MHWLMASQKAQPAASSRQSAVPKLADTMADGVDHGRAVTISRGPGRRSDYPLQISLLPPGRQTATAHTATPICSVSTLVNVSWSLAVN